MDKPVADPITWKTERSQPDGHMSRGRANAWSSEGADTETPPFGNAVTVDIKE